MFWFDLVFKFFIFIFQCIIEVSTINLLIFLKFIFHFMILHLKKNGISSGSLVQILIELFLSSFRVLKSSLISSCLPLLFSIFQNIFFLQLMFFIRYLIFIHTYKRFLFNTMWCSYFPFFCLSTCLLSSITLHWYYLIFELVFVFLGCFTPILHCT